MIKNKQNLEAGSCAIWLCQGGLAGNPSDLPVPLPAFLVYACTVVPGRGLSNVKLMNSRKYPVTELGHGDPKLAEINRTLLAYAENREPNSKISSKTCFASGATSAPQE